MDTGDDVDDDDWSFVSRATRAPCDGVVTGVAGDDDVAWDDVKGTDAIGLLFEVLSRLSLCTANDGDAVVVDVDVETADFWLICWTFEDNDVGIAATGLSFATSRLDFESVCITGESDGFGSLWTSGLIGDGRGSPSSFGV